MSEPLIHNETLGRLIRSGGWAELAEGTPRLVARALDAGDMKTARALADFLRQEMEVVFNIYSMWFPDTLKCLRDKGMPEAEVTAAHDAIRQTLSRWHRNVLRPRDEVWAEVEAAIAAVTAEATADRRAAVDAAVDLWRDLHDSEVDQLAGLFDLVITRHGEPALREMYEGWVIGSWFAKRYQRFDVSKIDWAEASWLLTYLGFEGMHGHLSGTARDGTLDYSEDDEKVTISFAPCGSGGRSMAGEPRDGLPPLRDPAIGWPELREAHDFTWNETGICAYCAHCCILHENLPIAAFGYPVRVTHPPKAPLTGESRCSWTVYKDVRAIPEEAYTRVGAVKPPAEAPLGSAGREERDRILEARRG
ncbi:hypothetical protein [Roseisalinus antarcticus]|uniref:Uncharacterized protein n=1 Tax=Roseisalinus antarcticus TaxID=254357 RepID=A0A1Y5THX6_9RHOB|nr:hypothetical protein [Roseisalinus antarcticus]SLN64508.1 hypothetical protein ROA7023_03021 [Roseisalinus antarcticus]